VISRRRHASNDASLPPTAPTKDASDAYPVSVISRRRHASNDTSLPPTAPTKDNTPPGREASTYDRNDLSPTVSKTPSIVAGASAPTVTSCEVIVMDAPRDRRYSACSGRAQLQLRQSRPEGSARVWGRSDIRVPRTLSTPALLHAGAHLVSQSPTPGGRSLPLMPSTLGLNRSPDLSVTRLITL
jgi:hypothetical protein